MLLADFTSATILISFGALLGKTSPLQLTIMAFFEVIFSLVNEFIAVEFLGVSKTSHLVRNTQMASPQGGGGGRALLTVLEQYNSV